MEFEPMIRFAQSLDYSRDSIQRLYEFLLKSFAMAKPPEITHDRKGTLITFDGHSGSGKDTHIGILRDYLAQNASYGRFRVVDLVQKKSNPFRHASKYLWANPHLLCDGDCSFLLLTAGRKYFVETMVLPLLEDSTNIVIQNRSHLSHIAYHASDLEELPALLDLSYFDPHADVPFVLVCDTTDAFERVKKRSPTKNGIIYPNEMPAYISRVTKNFEELRKHVNNLVFVDTSCQIDESVRQIRDHVDTYFTRRQAA